MAKKKATINKSAEIRKIMVEKPTANANQIVEIFNERFAKQASIKPSNVYNVIATSKKSKRGPKSKPGPKTRKTTTTKRTTTRRRQSTNGVLSGDHLFHLKQIADELGGMDALSDHVEALKRLN
jgi:hypothetical protein